MSDPPPTDIPPDGIDLIKGRRSIRRYEHRPVPEELVRQLLEAAMDVAPVKE